MTHINKKVSIAVMVALFIVVMFFSVVILPSKAYAATPIYVDAAMADDTGDGLTPATAKRYIQSGITLADSGGTVNVAVGTYYENLFIDKSLSLIGAGAGSTIIDGSGVNRVVEIGGSVDVTINGFTITNGYGDTGGGIYNNGTLTVTNATISGNTVNFIGGGIYNEYGTVTVTNATISGNTAGDIFEGLGGGIFNGLGTLTVTNSTISSNTARGGGIGGGILNSGTATVTNSTITGNTATYGGGGIYNGYGKTVSVTESTISGNTVNYMGGGIYNEGGTVSVTESTISGNIATYAGYGGGGIFNYTGTVTVTNTTISGNTASQGGGIYNYIGTAEATHNWWGASTGPSGGVTDPVTGEIADGDGDEILGSIYVTPDSISFDPWYIDEEMTTLSDYIPPIDTTPPVITLNGDNPLAVPYLGPYIELGATWTDAVDGTGRALVSGDTVDVTTPGNYTIRYNYTDVAGNVATEVTRTVIVLPWSTINVTKNVLNWKGKEITNTTQFTVQNNGTDNKIIAEGITATYDMLPPGTYTITELTEDRFVLKQIIGDSDSDPSNGAIITVGSGETANLTFINWIFQENKKVK